VENELEVFLGLRFLKPYLTEHSHWSVDCDANYLKHTYIVMHRMLLCMWYNWVTTELSCNSKLLISGSFISHLVPSPSHVTTWRSPIIRVSIHLQFPSTHQDLACDLWNFCLFCTDTIIGCWTNQIWFCGSQL
jgi:hypothetical protein